MERVKPKILMTCPECGTILTICPKCNKEFTTNSLILCDDNEYEHYHEVCTHESVN